MSAAVWLCPATLQDNLCPACRVVSPCPRPSCFLAADQDFIVERLAAMLRQQSFMGLQVQQGPWTVAKSSDWNAAVSALAPCFLIGHQKQHLVCMICRVKQHHPADHAPFSHPALSAFTLLGKACNQMPVVLTAARAAPPTPPRSARAPSPPLTLSSAACAVQRAH